MPNCLNHIRSMPFVNSSAVCLLSGCKWHSIGWHGPRWSAHIVCQTMHASCVWLRVHVVERLNLHTGSSGCTPGCVHCILHFSHLSWLELVLGAFWHSTHRANIVLCSRQDILRGLHFFRHLAEGVVADVAHVLAKPLDMLKRSAANLLLEFSVLLRWLADSHRR